ncbi:hypothetical protein DEJ51_21110 [Streptomyces venezuelae]|uniref:Uncharacterized protein n=1 Tax=Streptomyces venezuelae TaxID=54571 RepID=A0A5P2DMS4_STRVZ|nr:hypothetical protein [Streptomyces venezuelae]QES56366.1 hypothetical protein DEJ51_21110 [Streptomyces venezuelae]
MGLILLLIALVLGLALAFVGLAMILTASAVMGVGTVAVSRKLPLWARITLLLTAAAAPAVTLASSLGSWAAWQLGASAPPFLATVAAGAAVFAFEAHKRRAPGTPARAWPVRHAPAAGR